SRKSENAEHTCLGTRSSSITPLTDSLSHTLRPSHHSSRHAPHTTSANPEAPRHSPPSVTSTGQSHAQRLQVPLATLPHLVLKAGRELHHAEPRVRLRHEGGQAFLSGRRAARHLVRVLGAPVVAANVHV